MISMIAAADRNWAIGREGKLLTSIPDDLRFFRDTTRDKVVIMGRKTLQSLPGGRPLPNRTTIVVTRDPAFTMSDVTVKHSVEEALDYPGTKVLMKSGKSMPKVLETLRNKGCLATSSMVANCGLPGETVCPDLCGELPSDPGYFVTVVVK